MVPLGTTALRSPAALREVKAQNNYMHFYEEEFSVTPKFTTGFQQVLLTDTSKFANCC